MGTRKKMRKILKRAEKKLSILNESAAPKNEIPQALLCEDPDPAVFFGLTNDLVDGRYVGMPQGTEGNVLVIGGNGSGKSAGIVMPTLKRWRGSICAIDIKGELSDRYKELFESGCVSRPYLIFDPTDIKGPSYDPFAWLAQDNGDDLLSKVLEIVQAIIQNQPDAKEPFWFQSYQAFVAAAILFYYGHGLSFSETLCRIMEHTTLEICEEINAGDNVVAKMILGQMVDMKKETLACIDRGVRNDLMIFATDRFASHALRGKREGAICFDWSHLEDYNIFVKIPADKIEQYRRVVILMCTQLIRHLERRPERDYAWNDYDETLLLLDEFPRFGKLEMLKDAVTTLRSKNVNFCITIQSIAQLDAIYGQNERRIILDNCQFKAILRADDAETQRYMSDLIGTYTHSQYSMSQQMDIDLKCTGCNVQVNQIRDRVVQPHELAMLEDILLLSPFGFCRVKKCFAIRKTLKQVRFSVGKPAVYDETEEADEETFDNFRNEDAVMLTIKERTQNANDKVKAAAKKQRVSERQDREAEKRKSQRLCYIVGEMVVKHFPDLLAIEPGTSEENAVRFRQLEELLEKLADDPEFRGWVRNISCGTGNRKL